MTAITEYAKLVKLNSKSAGRGIQANITLPTSVTFNGNTGNYVNFYLGGFTQAECGLSYRKGNAGFRWFANDWSGTVGSGSWGEFALGQTVNLKLVVDEPDASDPNKELFVRFYVNGAEKMKYTYTKYKKGQTDSNLRLVLAAGSSTYYPQLSQMPAWDVWHSQVAATGLKIKNTSSNTWTALTGSNSTLSNLHWPLKEHTDTPIPCPNPQNYILDSSYLYSSTVYASLKQ
ncbi:hypothetical protein NSS79_24115 [Paenibacillus sp. FSL L8-0436]|uniref:hypothetical protein n=1 Tax=Paenibacillus sp. FSL L8-0436 TaxID=2954686 RepID=UPI0031591D69